MKNSVFLYLFLISTAGFTQDTTMNNLVKDMDNDSNRKTPVRIFDSQKAINANTTETVGLGKMVFRVTHNFGDLAGSGGGLKNFFGIDNAVDIRIAFDLGLGKNFDMTFARSKGASQIQRLWEWAIKWRICNQYENDPSHPLAIALFANIAVSSNKASAFDNLDHSFRSFSDRISNVFQLILAQKFGKVSLQLNPTLVTRNYAISYDQQSMFALGGAIRIPMGNRVNFVVDYFKPFRKDAVEDSFRVKNNLRYYNPLGIGFEILTSGHIFHLNFTNATEILENRFIPRTTTSWGKGQFRWGFTIARRFSLFRAKE